LAPVVEHWRLRAGRLAGRGAQLLAGVADRALSPGGNGPVAAEVYGQLWSPRDEEEAMSQILNCTDPAVFERTGQELAGVLAALAGPEPVMLDAGCGIGRVARYAARHCRSLWAADASEAMLAMARRRLANLGNIRFTRCLGTRLPEIPDASVDLAYSVLVLQHLEREDAFLLLGDIHRVLRPGGRLYVTFPNLLDDGYLTTFIENAEGGHMANPSRTRLYTPQEVGRLLPAAGFEPEEVEAGTEIVAVCRRR
jgi:SAM-dependent methyltransferase